MDCMDGMKQLKNNSIDIVFTSVPFKNEDVNCENDDDYWELYSSWQSEMMRVASKVVIVIQSASRLNAHVSMFPPMRTLIWGKGVIMSNCRFNPIFVYQKSDEHKIGKYIWCDCFGVEPVAGEKFKRIGGDKIHKYQDPLILYQTILGMFKDYKTVLDPFAGSGTTCLAAIKLHFDYISFEKDKECFDKANERIEAFKSQGRLFEVKEETETSQLQIL